VAAKKSTRQKGGKRKKKKRKKKKKKMCVTSPPPPQVKETLQQNKGKGEGERGKESKRIGGEEVRQKSLAKT